MGYSNPASASYPQFEPEAVGALRLSPDVVLGLALPASTPTLFILLSFGE